MSKRVISKVSVPKRVVAALIDGIFIGIFSSLFITLFGRGLIEEMPLNSSSAYLTHFTQRVLPLMITAVIGISYFSYFESGDHSASPGKKLLGIKLMAIDNKKPTRHQVVRRSIFFYSFFILPPMLEPAGGFIGATLYLLGFCAIAWAVYDKNGCGLHDKLSKTVVVYS